MKKKLNYLNKDFERSTGHTTHVKWYSVLIETSHTKRYHAGMILLAKLPPLPRLLIDFICEVMTEDNVIENTNQLKKDFNSRLKKIKKKNMSIILLIAPFLSWLIITLLRL